VREEILDRRRPARLEVLLVWVPVLKEDSIALNSVPLTAETLAQADCVIIVTDHAAIDYKLIARHARAAVDTRHVLPKAGTRA